MDKRRKVILIIFLVVILIIFFIFILYRNDKTGDQISGQPSANDETKVLFEKYLSEVFPEEGKDSSVRYFQFSDSQGKPIPLSKLTEAIAFKIHPSVAALTDDSDYSLISCFQDGTKSYGISLKTNSLPDNQNSYREISRAMQEWEPTMFSDISPILFPDVPGSNLASLNPNIVFRDGNFRYTIINMPDGSKKSINYYTTLDSIVIATSKECLYETAGY